MIGGWRDVTRRRFMLFLTFLGAGPASRALGAAGEGGEETDPDEDAEEEGGDEDSDDGDDDSGSDRFDHDHGSARDFADLNDRTSTNEIHLLDESMRSFFDDRRESTAESGREYSLGLSYDMSRPGARLSEGVPSAVDREQSIFDRVTAAHQRYFGNMARNEGAAARLAEVATHVWEQERAARSQDKGFLGAWARDVERGTFGKGDYKCNIAFGEWSEKAGLTPIYRDGRTYADTKTILKQQDSLNCWKPTDTPKRGDAIVLQQRSGAGHIGVVTDPANGLAISAGEQVTGQYRHWGPDQNGVARPIWNTKSSAADMKDPQFSERPEPLFLKYHCPDQKILGRFPNEI